MFDKRIVIYVTNKRERESIMKKIVLVAACLIFGGSIIAKDIEESVGSITGTVTVRGVRDARDVVVYLENVAGEYQPPAENPVIDQRNLVFIPHVLPVLVGTTVKFQNNDKVRHNIFSPSKSKKFNLGTYSAGVTREVTFDKLGKVSLLCNVHAEMSAYVYVLQNPFHALTGPDGVFAISDIPPGEYTIKTWHEKLKEKKQQVTVAKGDTVTVDLGLSR